MQAAWVDGKLERLPGAHGGPGGHPRGPQQLAAAQRRDSVVFLIMMIGGARQARVLDRRVNAP
jgi:hypothetical protein